MTFYFACRLTITASCPMNLEYFPMDRQLCHIEIESCKYSYLHKNFFFRFLFHNYWKTEVVFKVCLTPVHIYKNKFLLFWWKEKNKIHGKDFFSIGQKETIIFKSFRKIENKTKEENLNWFLQNFRCQAFSRKKSF